MRTAIAGAAGAAMLLATGCSTASKAAKVPADLCALMAAPPLAQFIAGELPSTARRTTNSRPWPTAK
ncbi:hypothetical protein ACU686_12125 [Yinghuangia aomiensis]